MAEIYTKNPDVVFRKIADECVLVPIKNNIGDMGAIYTLNETAARAWELIDGKRSSGELAGAIAGEFDVSIDEATRDLEELFAHLVSAGTVKEVER